MSIWLQMLPLQRQLAFWANLDTLLSRFWTHASFSLLGLQAFQAALCCLAAHLPLLLNAGKPLVLKTIAAAAPDTP